jgi:uncharacterized protein YraI
MVLARSCLMAMIVALPIQALAQKVVTLRPVNVRAGPDRSFPVVTPLNPNTPVHIFGCLSGWVWCDVASGRSRGWVQSSYLNSFFRDRTPVITFSVESYWDEHYRRRPWYSQRSKWLNWQAPTGHP